MTTKAPSESVLRDTKDEMVYRVTGQQEVAGDVPDVRRAEDWLGPIMRRAEVEMTEAADKARFAPTPTTAPLGALGEVDMRTGEIRIHDKAKASKHWAPMELEAEAAAITARRIVSSPLLVDWKRRLHKVATHGTPPGHGGEDFCKGCAGQPRVCMVREFLFRKLIAEFWERVHDPRPELRAQRAAGG
jgi:hypothetical protein